MLRSRIAPTPSGFLHKGNAINFLLTSMIVKSTNGSLQLRIDDLDIERMRKEYVADIFETLHWMDISWNKVPLDENDFYKNYSQQIRIARYHDLVNDLIETGKVFACICSRKTISQEYKGLYPCTCRKKNMPFNTPDTALRIITPNNVSINFKDVLQGSVHINLNETMPDFIIRRRDGKPAYHIASLADDIDNDINFIVRGEDLLQSTAMQLYLASLLHEPKFQNAIFCHHPLIKDSDGRKLSKSAGVNSTNAMRLVNQGDKILNEIKQIALGIFEKIQLSLPPFLA